MTSRWPLSRIAARGRVSLLCAAIHFTLALAGKTLAAERAQLFGKATDAATGEPLPGVQVLAEGTFLGTTTDAQGRYRLLLPPGEYWIVARMMGYETERRHVSLGANQQLQLDFPLRQTVLRAPEVVVSASKRYQLLAESPQSVAVLSREQILSRNRLYLDEYLEYAPGVTLVDNQVNIRGSSGYSRGAGSRVLLLVDGVPMMPGDSGDIKWDVIPVDQIGQVEIVKGAGSALYGSSALGGVINVMTLDPTGPPRTMVRCVAGAYDQPPYPEWRWTNRVLRFSEWSISHSREIGSAGITAYAKRSESSGYKVNGHYSRWNVFTKALWRPDQRDRVELTVTGSTDNYGANLMWPDQSRALEVAPDAVGDYIRSTKLLVAAQWRRAVSARLAHRFRFSGFGNGWTDYFHDSHDYSRARQYGVEYQLDYLLGGSHPLTAGIEGSYGRVRANIFGRREISDIAAYAQLDLRLSRRLILNPGLRVDASQRDRRKTEKQVSPKIGLVWRLSSGTTVRASLGSGFRAPSVAEAYSQTYVSGLRVEPNPELKAERGWTAETSALYELRNLRLEMAAFHSYFQDLIEPQADVTNTVRFRNVTRGRLTGLEVGARWAQAVLLGRADLGINYLYLDTEDLSLHQPLAYRARHLAQANFEWRYRRWRVGADYRYVSRMERVQIYYRDDRVPQKVLDCRLSLETQLGLLSLEVDNALNYAYTQIERNLEPIRSYKLTFQRAF
ncbi:MAG: TonB-dependent receptor [candidate division KSB1 bacterium]|nr:TonB-dependent receptor [candidate division KSB1 bacterium]